MTEDRPLAEATRQRLALLRRILEGLEDPGWTRVTSRDLGRWLGTTPDTVRKDLAGTGPGTPGAAYEVAELLRRLEQALPAWEFGPTALTGLGDLGLALAASAPGQPGPWSSSPWRFVVGFDGRPNRLEQVDLPFPLYPTTEIVSVCRRMEIDAAVLAVGPAEVQRVAERLVQAGVRRLVNYSPRALRVDRHRVAVWEFGRP